MNVGHEEIKGRKISGLLSISLLTSGKKLKVILYWWFMISTFTMKVDTLDFGTQRPQNETFREWQRGGAISRLLLMPSSEKQERESVSQQQPLLWLFRCFDRKYSLTSLRPPQTKIYVPNHYSHSGRLYINNQEYCIYQSMPWISYLTFLILQ